MQLLRMQLLNPLVLFLIMCTSFVCASQNKHVYKANDEASALSYIISVASDEQLSPTETLELLTQVITDATTKKWESAFLQASIIKIEKHAGIHQYDEARLHLEQIKTRLQASNNEEFIVRASLVDLRISMQQGTSLALYTKFNRLLAIANKLDNRRVAGSVYLAVGRAHSKLSDYANAVKALSKAYEVAEAVDDRAFLDVVVNEIGNVNIRMKNFSEGIKYYQRSLRYSKEKGATYTQIVTLYNIGQAHSRNLDFKAAEEAFNQGLVIAIKVDDKRSQSWLLRGLADLAIVKQDWTEAIRLYTQVLPQFEKSGNKNALLNIKNGLLEAYIETKDVQKASMMLERTKNLLLLFPNKANQQHLNMLNANLLILRGDYKGAYYKVIKNLDLLKEIHEEEKQSEVNNLRLRLDSKFQENENKRLQQELEINQLRITQQENEKKLWLLIIVLGSLLILIGSFLLIRQVVLRKQYKKLALRDHLTKAPNRRSVITFLKRSIKELKRNKSCATVILIDLDHFKILNDNYGHDTGDKVLIAFAQACQISIRSNDSFGRYGGEEWLVIVNDSCDEIASAVVNRIKDNFIKCDIDGLPKSHKLSFSAGLQHIRFNSENNIDAVIRMADEKLYRAKQSGRDRFIL